MGKAEIAKKIKDARIAKGLTQADVAQQLGITPQAISNFERGKNRISNDILRSLCELYDISADLVLDNLLVGKIVPDKAGNPTLQWEEAKPIPPWVKENMKYTDALYRALEGLGPAERLGFVSKEIKTINPTEIEFFLAEKLYSCAPEDKDILSMIVDSLPNDTVLRIQNVKIALIAALNIKKNKLPF